MSIESVKKQYQDDLGKYASNEKERQFLINSIDKIFDDYREFTEAKIERLTNSRLVSKETAIQLADMELDGMFRSY